MWLVIFFLSLFIIKGELSSSLFGLDVISAPACVQLNRRPGRCYLKDDCIQSNSKLTRFRVCERNQNGMPITLCCDEMDEDNNSPYYDDDNWSKKMDFECGISYFKSADKPIRFLETMNSMTSRQAMSSMNAMRSKFGMMSSRSNGPNLASLSGVNAEPPNTIKPLEIIAGKNSSEGSHPWIVALWYKGSFICGGSVVNKKTVLTAAHCFEASRDPKDYTVTVGSNMLDQGKRYTIAKLIIHPGYLPPPIYNDIALIIIESKFVFSSFINAICLASKHVTNPIIAAQSAVVIGFGVTSYGGIKSNVLQETSLPLVINKQCAEKYNPFSIRFPFGLMDTFICAGYQQGGKDSCQGDSGGPLMITSQYGKAIQIGIVSFGFRCAEPGYPGVYTNVAYYHQWIMQNAVFN